MTETIEWDPEEWEFLGDCVVCGGPVYPANPYVLHYVWNRKEPVAHSACGW